jgi:hypothetical protein
MGSNNQTLLYLTEQLHMDFLKYLTVRDMIALTTIYNKNSHSRTILRHYIHTRINAFPSHASVAGQITPLKYISGETSGGTRTERWMFTQPVYSWTLPVDTFETILSMPLNRIVITSPFIQYTNRLIPPEKLQDRMAEWCVRQTSTASVWVYYSYDDYEMLSNGSYYDFLNQSYDHLVIRGVRISYNVSEMNDRVMYILSGIAPFIRSISTLDTKATILLSGLWAVICALYYCADTVIHITPQPTIF